MVVSNIYKNKIKHGPNHLETFVGIFLEIGIRIFPPDDLAQLLHFACKI